MHDVHAHALNSAYLRRVYLASARRSLRGMRRALVVFMAVAGVAGLTVAALGMIA